LTVNVEHDSVRDSVLLILSNRECQNQMLSADMPYPCRHTGVCDAHHGGGCSFGIK
jgi:hypothetical protein